MWTWVTPPRSHNKTRHKGKYTNVVDVAMASSALCEAPPGESECDAVSTASNTSSESSVSGDPDSSNLRCGYGKYSPDCLQKFNTSKWLLVCICWFTFVQSFVVNGINNVNTASLERRFDLPSRQVAWITSAYDLFGGFLSIVAGYLATWANKPRMMTIMAAVMALGSFIMFLPHLITGPYELGNRVVAGCLGNSSANYCEQEETPSSLSNFKYVFILGQILHSFGGIACYTVGTPYMDENIDTKNTPLYIGIMQGLSALGPAVGFIVGGLFLNLYVDVGRVDMDEIDIGPTDPRWVGAWWIGFATASLAGVSVVVFMACFPRELPEARKHRQNRVSEAYKGKEDEDGVLDPRGAVVQVKGAAGFCRSFMSLLRNPTWGLMTLGGIMEAGTVVAFATFMPKLMQFQFGVTPAQAAMLTGCVVVPAAAVGQVVGGMIPRWLGLRVKGLILQCAAGCAVGAVLSFIFLFRCDTTAMAGVTVQYHNSDIPLAEPALSHPCNAHCACSTQSYEPVCGANGVQYFSPCYAGCTDSHVTDEFIVYNHCSCVEYDTKFTNTSTQDPSFMTSRPSGNNQFMTSSYLGSSNDIVDLFALMQQTSVHHTSAGEFTDLDSNSSMTSSLPTARLTSSTSTARVTSPTPSTESLRDTTPTGASGSSAMPWQAYSGICQTDCDTLKLFLPIFFTLILGAFMSNTAWHAVTIRCVPDRQRTFAFGLQGTIIRVLGATPMPILVGLMLDQTCIVWQETCDGSGSCWLYDSSRLALLLFIVNLCVKLFSTSCFLLAYFTYKPPKGLELKLDVNGVASAEDASDCEVANTLLKSSETVL